MELFTDDNGLKEIEILYAEARTRGIEWVQFLDVCFDGGDSIQEASGLFWQAVRDCPNAEVYFNELSIS